MSEVKKELIKILSEFYKAAPKDKKPYVKVVADDIKNRNFNKTDELTNFDESALLLFHLTNGLDLVTPKDRARLHQYGNKLSHKLGLSEEHQAGEKLEDQLKPEKKGPTSTNT